VIALIEAELATARERVPAPWVNLAARERHLTIAARESFVGNGGIGLRAIVEHDIRLRVLEFGDLAQFDEGRAAHRTGLHELKHLIERFELFIVLRFFTSDAEMIEQLVDGRDRFGASVGHQHAEQHVALFDRRRFVGERSENGVSFFGGFWHS